MPDVLDGTPAGLAALEQVAIDAARVGADVVRLRRPDRSQHATKSSPTDLVTPTDRESERLIRRHLIEATPGAGFVGEESGATGASARLQWIVDPLDGTVNFWYGLPVLAVSVAAALDGTVVAGAVADIAGGAVYSATRRGGSRCDGEPVDVSACEELPRALVTTGFGYDARVRADQGGVVARLLPRVRDIRCFGSAALQLCWVGCGRTDAHFERAIKIWDYAAGALIAAEGGATVELPCPENDDLVIAATTAVFEPLRDLVDAAAPGPEFERPGASPPTVTGDANGPRG